MICRVTLESIILRKLPEQSFIAVKFLFILLNSKPVPWIKPPKVFYKLPNFFQSKRWKNSQNSCSDLWKRAVGSADLDYCIFFLYGVFRPEIWPIRDPRNHGVKIPGSKFCASNIFCVERVPPESLNIACLAFSPQSNFPPIIWIFTGYLLKSFLL